jgi:predicted outer membrane repeat protein
MISLFGRRAHGARGPVVRIFVLAVAAAGVPAAWAENIVVNTLNDGVEGATACSNTGACNLRDAVLKANRNDGPDSIGFVSGLSGTITLSHGELSVSDNLTLTGPGVADLTLVGTASTRIFNVSYEAPDMLPINVTISGLSMTGASSSSDGGAIFVDNANLTLTDCAVSGNHSEGGGGALFMAPTVAAALVVQRCTFDGNSAALNGGGLMSQDVGSVQLDALSFTNNTTTHYAGGAYLLRVGTGTVSHSFFKGNHAGTFSLGTGHGGAGLAATGDKVSATLSITDSRFENNITDHGWGGGIALNTFGAATLQRLEISGNTAGNNGGGIRSTSASVSLQNSTLSGNQATAAGGGMAVDLAGDVTFENVTDVGNGANVGGGLSLTANTSASAHNSILANNTGATGVDTNGAIALHYSLLRSTSGGSVAPGSANNLPTGTDPLLGTLGVNGGTSLTLLPASTSPLLNAGDPATAGSTDQRGLPRVIGAHVDIGAVERQSPEEVIFRNSFDG